MDNFVRFLQFDVLQYVMRIFKTNKCYCCDTELIYESHKRPQTFVPRYQGPFYDDNDLVTDCLGELLQTNCTDCEDNTDCSESIKKSPCNSEANSLAKTETECLLEGFKRDSCDCFNGDQKTDSSTSSKSGCNLVCQKVAAKVSSKCAEASLCELKAIENRAVQLWDSLKESFGSKSTLNWAGMAVWQRLPFYWVAMSNEILLEDPFENFLRFYETNFRTRRGISLKRISNGAQNLWKELSPRQKLPFTIEAVIARIASGKVNIKEHKKIQRIISKV